MELIRHYGLEYIGIVMKLTMTTTVSIMVMHAFSLSFIFIENVMIENPMQFSLLSVNSVDSDPPVFTLSFNVTNYPPSVVTCTVDGVDVRNIDIEREVIISICIMHSTY